MLMGNIKKKNLVAFLLLSFLFFHSCSSSNEFQYSKNLGWSPSDYNNKTASLLSPHDDHEYMIKNSEPPYFMKKQSTRDEEEGGLIMSNNKKSKRNMKMKTRSLNLKSSSNREKSSSSDNWSRKRTYSAMLPKGFVPPSGSSPCHNTYPNSVTFFCHLSTSNKLP